MVTVTNGLQTVVVSNGAFREIYQPQGWSRVLDNPQKTPLEILSEVPVKEESIPVKEPEQEEKDTEAPQDDTEEVVKKEYDETNELLLRPLSDLSVEELRTVAELKDIDITGLKLKAELRQAIKIAIK